MLRPVAALTAALLAASPAAALSVSSSACNEDRAELIVSDDAGTSLTVNGAEVPLEEGFDYEDLACVSHDGVTQFGLIRLSPEDEEAYFLLDPETLEMTEVTEAEAIALDFFEDEDDWELGLLDDED